MSEAYQGNDFEPSTKNRSNSKLSNNASLRSKSNVSSYKKSNLSIDTDDINRESEMRGEFLPDSESNVQDSISNQIEKLE